MTISEEFAEGRDFLQPARPEGVDMEAFKKFVEKHGSEVAKGYIMASHDLLPRVENIWMSPGDAGKRKSALALYHYIEGVLELGLDLGLNEKSNSNANMSPPSPT